MRVTGINGTLDYAQDVIYAGNSGIVLRFCSAIGALAKHPVVITGDKSIRLQRPMKPLLEGLSKLGVSATSMRGDGYAPVIIQGPIKPGKTIVHGEDSQPVSALLIASAFADGPVEIEVLNPGELPWISLTLDWFDRLGIRYENRSYTHYKVFGKTEYRGFEYNVPGDLSSAAFPIAAALMTQSEITLNNVDMNDSQGDKELIHVFQQMGADIEIDDSNKSLRVKRGKPLHGVIADINNFVDGITILAVVAGCAEGEKIIHNAAVAKQKECNRIRCIATELKKMGADITETDDGLIIRKSVLKGALTESYHDHRMAMSLAVAGMNAEGDTRIQGVDCVSKTFPSFTDDFKTLGCDITRIL